MMTGRRVAIIDLVYQGQINDVKALIAAGCDVNEKSYEGEAAQF